MIGALIGTGAGAVVVQDVKSVMRKLPQVELPTEHFFATHLYGRAVSRPFDTTIAGAVHRREHFYIVLRGRVAVYGDGNPAQIYEQGTIVVSKPGTERLVVALEDSVCMTVHYISIENPTIDDLAAIEAELVEADPESPFDVGNKLKALPCHS